MRVEGWCGKEQQQHTHTHTHNNYTTAVGAQLVVDSRGRCVYKIVDLYGRAFSPLYYYLPFSYIYTIVYSLRVNNCNSFGWLLILKCRSFQ
jgi:hypothetical protein